MYLKVEDWDLLVGVGSCDSSISGCGGISGMGRRERKIVIVNA